MTAAKEVAAVFRANDLVSDIEVQVLAVKTMLGMVDENVQSLLTNSDASNRVVYLLEDIATRMNTIGETFQPLLAAIHGSAANQGEARAVAPAKTDDSKIKQLRPLLTQTSDAIYRQEALCMLVPAQIRGGDTMAIEALSASIRRFNDDLYELHKQMDAIANPEGAK